MEIVLTTLLAAAVSALAAVLLIGAHSRAAARDQRQALAAREAVVAKSERGIAAYRQRLGALAGDLAKRQDFIEKMVDAELGDVAAGADRAAPDDGDAAASEKLSVKKLSAAVPEAAGMLATEARQFAMVDRLTRFAEAHADADAQRIRALGLNPKAMRAAVEERGARGGPLVRLATASDGSVDPRFARLGTSIARMDALARGLEGVPQVLPARADYISSGFGYRSDPFDGSAAFHAGLDFAGPRGAPIYAAAPGTVRFAGIRQGYGNCIEIDHGNGLVTRYAHMSAYRAHVGEKVAAGDVIGAIGSTGRSTGPHLHFEVRIHDRPVNPGPFLAQATR